MYDGDGGKGHDDFGDYPNLYDFPYVRSPYGEYFQLGHGFYARVIPSKKDTTHLQAELS